MDIVIAVWLGFVGLSFGSFVNALVWRLKNNKTFVNDRSMCTHCKHVLAWYDLVPVLSWLSLGGKCRYCKKTIEDTPVSEILTAVLFVLSYALWVGDFSDSIQYVLLSFWLAQVVGLVALAIYDVRWMLLPNKLLFPMTGLAVAQRLFESIFISMDAEPLKDMILGVLVGGGIFYVLFQVSAGRWIGGGDVKLGFLIGALLGPLGAAIALMLGFYSASIFLLPLMALKKVTRKSKIPFGPFLIIGLIATVLFEPTLVDWFKNLYGIDY